MNRVTLIGRLGQDAELKFTQGGQAVANFSVATTEKWKDSSGAKQERTEWHRCVWWGKGAEAVSQYIRKGDQIGIEGSIQSRKWRDKDGNDRVSYDIKVENVELLGGGNGRAHGEQRAAPAASRGASSWGNDGQGAGNDIPDAGQDDIPF